MTVRIRAFAKVNLYLRILDRRPDGFHNLETVFHTVGLADDLAFSPGPTLRLVTSGLPTPRGGDNLCLRAARLLMGPQTLGATIRLMKRIPAGAGLGGGSADAAACLVGLNRLWRLGRTRPALALLAAKLGSDVPFFLGGSAAVGRGRGETLTPIPSRLRGWVVILKPRFSINTGEAYAAWDRLQKSGRLTCPAATLKGVVRAVRLGRINSLRVHNDFEQVAAARHPRLGDLRTGLLRSGAAVAFLTGSGSAMVGLYGEAPAARAAARALQRRFRVTAFAVPIHPGG